ncbi:hypothetical protein AUC71_11565 [Methyloceanibacter marginalis]|uniref:Carboxyltransferase domain-containing protein n=1 Tax=Methyloceanibacter marginalis TaxID=1774971 RepID=A0A1E3WBI6_9HYPH|nr:hypothetical protein AUC71_11565 [Methyloceanibacter marginalis]
MVGAGPAGTAAALALAHVGAKVALIGPPPPKAETARPETRTAALLTSSVDLLKRLNVWEALGPHAAPLKAIRIVDASRSLLRSPDIAFEAQELGLGAFGYNVANTVLNEALYARAQDAVAQVIPESVAAIAIGDRAAELSLSEGSTLTARLVAGADGRQSLCRDAAGIETTLSGPTLKFNTDTVVALGGAELTATLDAEPVPYWQAVPVKTGQVLKLGGVQGPGTRAYIAVRGGIDVPLYLGSRSTFTLGKFGGHAGRV